MADFLLEIYGEEIPPKSQIEGKRTLHEIFSNFLKQKKINFDNIETFSSARRFVLIITNLPKSIDSEVKKLRGPAKSSNKIAVEGFIKTNKLKDVNDLIIENVKGKDYFFHVKKLPSEDLNNVFSNFIPQALKSFGWKKSMRWSDNKDKWIRPIKKILCVFDEKVVNFKFANIKSSSSTIGNYLYSNVEKEIVSILEYKDFLKDSNVVLEDSLRKDMILSNLESICKKFNLKINFDQKLINEVSGLVEYPNVFLGKFDKSFFSMPENFLVTVLSNQQKYFSFKDEKNKLSDIFAFVSNHTNDKNNIIKKGNERVLRARFKDALFFIKEDLLEKLEDRFKKLENITYFENLGNLKDKSHRISKITEVIAKKINLKMTKSQKNISLLLKADLTTEMVKEFPSLQGYVGSYYAKLQGFRKEEYQAIEDQYFPISSNGIIPKSKFSICVAISDKVDNITSSFLAGKKPTGSKDPYSLRRSALAIIRILVENNINLNLYQIFLESINLFEYESLIKLNDQEIINFIMTRLIGYFKEMKVSSDVINSVATNKKELNPNLLFKRSRYIMDFRMKKNGKDFIASYKRVESILTNNNKSNDSIDVKLFVNSEEKKLYSYTSNLDKIFNESFIDSRYNDCVKKLFELTVMINSFFDKVKVNSEIKEQKNNRVNLLFFLKDTIDKVCNFSKLESL